MTWVCELYGFFHTLLGHNQGGRPSIAEWSVSFANSFRLALQILNLAPMCFNLFLIALLQVTISFAWSSTILPSNLFCLRTSGRPASVRCVCPSQAEEKDKDHKPDASPAAEAKQVIRSKVPQGYEISVGLVDDSTCRRTSLRSRVQSRTASESESSRLMPILVSNPDGGLGPCYILLSSWEGCAASQ